ncbi:MAG: MFS transporter [Planctomycetota bacterium]
MSGEAPSPVPAPSNRAVILVVTVAALGYFVDIFDLLLFGLVRKSSLTELMQAQLAGLSPEEADHLLTTTGVWLDNILQTTGLLVGGLFWGVLGDRRGRLSVLFGSIITYSLANLLNAAVTDVDADGPLGFLHALGLGSAINQYGVLRFVAGVGLAGELGAGITLVSELVSRERRGLATTIVAAVGILGAVAGYFTTQFVGWRTAFVIGGVLGLLLLALRIGVVESGMFRRAEHMHVKGRGAFWKLCWPAERLKRYAATVLIAVPIWFVVGTLVKYCDRIMPSMGMDLAEKPSPAKAIMWCYVGLAAGDLASGLLSQVLRSRKRAVFVFHMLTVVALALYFTVASASGSAFYAVICFAGFASGYWAVFATVAAEQFGTNLRATAATTAPNLVRWSAAWTGGLWLALGKPLKESDGWDGSLWRALGEPAWLDAPWKAALAVALVVMPVAILATRWLRESYGTDLDFNER